MNAVRTLLLVAAALSASPALAQSHYYARERLVGPVAKTAAAPAPTPTTKRTCGAFADNRYLPLTGRTDIEFFASPKADPTAAIARAKSDCESYAGAGALCMVTNGYSAAVCTNKSIAVPTGNSCYGVSIGPTQPLTSTGSGYYVASCTAN